MDNQNRNKTFKRVFRRAGRNKKRASERIQVKLAQELSKARKEGEAALNKFFAEIANRYPEYAYEPNTPPAQAKEEIKIYPPPAPSSSSSSSENVSFNNLVPFSSNASSASSTLLTKATPPAVRLNAKPAPVATPTSTEVLKEKTPDPVAPAAESKVEKTLVRTTLAQGDCLFSSIYRAAAERGLLPMFATCFGIATDTEMKFIKGIRDAMADYVLKEGLLKGKDRFGNPVDTYDQLQELVEGTEFQAKEQTKIAKGAMYAVAAQSFPGWFVSEFGRRGEKMGTKQEFTKKYAAGIRLMGNWTGELEVNLFNHLLAIKGCNVQLDATRTRPTELFRRMNGKEVITVYNPSMGHFEYFSFEMDDKKALGKEAYPAVAVTKIPVKKVGSAAKATAVTVDCKAVAEACQKNLLSPGVMKELATEIAFLKSNGIIKGGGTRRTERNLKRGNKTRKL